MTPTFYSHSFVRE